MIGVASPARLWRINLQTVIVVSLIFLFVYLFGAYAYGAATVYSLRSAGPIWGGQDDEIRLPESGGVSTRPTFALFVISTVWFVLHVLIEFRNFIGYDTKA